MVVAPTIGSGSMQLSILIATNRKGLLACSRIAQACSWAGPNLEVIVRDNSGDAQKRTLLPHFRRDNCNIIIADPCDGLTNLSECLRLVKGEFVFLLADDDFCFDHAIASLPSVLAQCRNDPSVVGVTGAYAVEASQGSSIVSYQNLEYGRRCSARRRVFELFRPERLAAMLRCDGKSSKASSRS